MSVASSRWARVRSGLGWLCVVGTAVALGLGGGFVGFVAGGGLVLGWIALPVVAAFAVGQVAVVALAAHAPWASLVLAQAGLVGILVVSAAEGPSVSGAVGPIGVAIGGLGAIALGTYTWTGALWLAALAVVGATAVAAYLLHRFGLVTLGVVDGE